MVLKLYGLPPSTCTTRVGVVLHEKQISYELINVDLLGGECRTPEYREKQPFEQIPYIDDDGYILYESRAICMYLEAKYPNQGASLAPPTSDVQAYGRFQQALSIEYSNFSPVGGAAVFEMVFKPLHGGKSDQAVFDSLIGKLDKKLDGYEAILGKQRYLAGEKITLADLHHLPTVALLEKAGSDIMKTKPNVYRWLRDITSRPSWQAVKDGVKSTSFD